MPAEKKQTIPDTSSVELVEILKAVKGLTGAIDKQGKVIVDVGERVQKLEDTTGPPMPQTPIGITPTPPPIPGLPPQPQPAVTPPPVPKALPELPGAIQKTVETPIEVPIPTEYRQKVNEFLGTDFGITITPLTDAPAFMLNIIVPERFNTLTPDQKEICKVDMRSKVMTYAEGVNGVVDHCKRVRQNLQRDSDMAQMLPQLGDQDIPQQPVAFGIGDGR